MAIHDVYYEDLKQMDDQTDSYWMPSFVHSCNFHPLALIELSIQPFGRLVSRIQYWRNRWRMTEKTMRTK